MIYISTNTIQDSIMRAIRKYSIEKEGSIKEYMVVNNTFYSNLYLLIEKFGLY